MRGKTVRRPNPLQRNIAASNAHSGGGAAMSSDDIFRLGSESAQTYRLKWAAWQWLYQAAGCRCLGFEVRLQGPWGAVIDVVGVGPGNLIYAVEVKSSRSDFARDNHTDADVARLRRQFHSLARRMELASAPAYRAAAGAAGSSDLERLRREWERLRARLSAISTKFHDPRFLAIADYHYIMAPAGVVRAERLPPSWGLLAPGSDAAAPDPHPSASPQPAEPPQTAASPQVVIGAPAKTIRKDGGIMANVLRAIARANAMMRAHGVRWGEDGAEFPPPGN